MEDLSRSFISEVTNGSPITKCSKSFLVSSLVWLGLAMSGKNVLLLLLKPEKNGLSHFSNYSKLKFMISSSVTEACNNSILLLGPHGSAKIAVLELVIQDLLLEYPDSISLIRLSRLLHSDDISAFKEIARQLCMEHQLLFSKAASCVQAFGEEPFGVDDGGSSNGLSLSLYIGIGWVRLFDAM